MARERTIINQTNNIVYVEPNYNYSTSQYDSNGLNTYEFIPDLEDYSIFVNLEIETIGRTLQTGNKVYKFSYVSKGDGESVNLMSGTKINTTDGGTINTLTTDYTDVHISNLKNKGASPELFGINYIDIAYNNFIVPEVTIEFVDIRGAAVFGQKELFESNNIERAIKGNYNDNIVNTFFQCFFTFPYPKFSLLVKGFYGQPVAYELTCADFRARFNSEDGSFSCTAKFVGYHFSFLNDVMLNALVSAPYSDFLGAEYWKQQGFSIRGLNGGNIGMPKIGELLKKMKQAEVAAEHISQSSPEVQEKNNIEQISKRYSELKNVYEKYVTSIKDLSKSLNTDEIQYFITDGDDNNIIEAAVIIVEDDVTESFEDHFDKNNKYVNGAYDSLKKLIEELQGEYSSINIPLGINFAKVKPSKRVSVVDGKFVIDADHKNDDIKENCKYLYDLFNTKVLNENTKSGVNGYKGHTKAYYFYDGGFTKKLNELMRSASDKEKELAEKIENTKQDALMQKLGFRPDVETMTRIMMAHFETFAYMIHKTAIMIENEDPKRDTKTLGITDDDDIADVPDRYRSDNTGCLIVPPFPKVTKIVNKNGSRNREESWVGDYGNMFKETDLVHGILNGIEEFVQNVSAGETVGGAGSTSTIKTVMKHPISVLDFFLTNSIYEEFSQNETSSLLSLVGLRALQALGTTNFSNWADKCEVLGAAEAENLIKAEKLTNDTFIKKLTSVTETDVVEMLKGNASTNIPKPSSGVWPWQEDAKSRIGVISNDNKGEFSICKVKTPKGYDVYTLPLQSLNWTKIKHEVLHSFSSAKSDNYFNIEREEITNDYKDNIFNIETNIDRIKNICETQMKEGIEGLDYYANIVLAEATYDSETYKGWFTDNTSYIVYPIKDAANLQPKNNTCMLPCTTSYAKMVSWGGGYEMKNFTKSNLGGKWFDKDGKEVTRVGDDGFNNFLNDLNTNNYTITEIPGLDEDFEPTTATSLFTEYLYYAQTDDRVKAFYFLTSLSYYFDYDKILSNEICSKDKTISIIPLPAVIYVGGLLWMAKNKNIEKIYKAEDRIKKLSVLDEQVKIKLIKTFENWITKGIPNNNIIVSFNEIKNNMEIGLLKRSHEQFFLNIDEMEDTLFFGKDRSWFKEGVFAKGNYTGILSFLVGEFDSSFFRNFICVSEDVGGRKNNKQKTVGLRVGNRDGSVGVKQVVDFALAPCIFTKNSKFFFNDVTKVLSVPTGNLVSFFKGFLERIKKEEPDNSVIDNSVSVAKETKTTTDIKVGVYRYCKLLYDKWIGGMSEADFEQFKLKSFFEGKDRYFHFIDSYYNLANEKLINIGKFLDMIVKSYESADYSLLSFLSSVYSENKFNFICVQNFADISRRENMINMFDCIPYTEYWEVKRHPNFIVMSVYEPSSHLELDGSEYENDSFMLNMPEHLGNNKWPEALKSRVVGESAGYNIPAFGVSYGKMYQSYFKDISVSMDNPTVTEQSIKAQWAIASLHNENSNQEDKAKEYTYGQDLYSIYSNNSYTCEVTMMGCAWVQPLMLFVLNNVPMFRGTYQIIKVSHHIQQGDMVTKFTGVRMANVATRTVEECSVSHSMNQTDAGLNSMLNRESAYANTDNDCPYMEYPILIGDVILTNDEYQNAMQLMNAIISRGYTKEQAAGIVGNIYAESGFNHKNVVCDSNKKLAGGLCMWNNNSLYWLINKKPEKVSQKMPQGEDMSCSNKTIESIATQLPTAGEQINFLLDSLEKDSYLNSDKIKVREHLLAAKTPEEAAYSFARYFERCDVCSNENSETVTQRKNNARRYYDNFVKGNFTPVIVNNGDGKVSEYANGFLRAVNQTSQSSSVNVEVGIDMNKSSGDTIYLTNAKNSPDFGKIYDIMLSTYSNKIDEITWIVPGNGENQNLPPEGYIVKLKDDTYFTKTKLINGGNGETVSAISLEEGGINDDFKRAITKKYKNTPSGVREKLMVREITPKLTEEQARQLFNNSKIKPCNEVMQDAPSNTQYEINGPFTSSNWDVNAFVKNLHYWQQNICEHPGGGYKTETVPRENYGGCGRCSGVINRALESTGLGRKYFKTYPWEIYDLMKGQNSDFNEIGGGTQTNRKEFDFNAFGINCMAGDICTMWSTPNRELHFHTCAFDGKKWVSDYIQNACNAYRSAGPCTMEFHIFRHK